MTDLELCAACARRVGLENVLVGVNVVTFTNSNSGGPRVYNPLENDAQMAALQKAFHLSANCYRDDADGWTWIVQQGAGDTIADYSLNRAIVKCVASLFEGRRQLVA